MSEILLSFVFVHYSDDDWKSVVSEQCLARLHGLTHHREEIEVVAVNNGKQNERIGKFADKYILNDRNSLGRARNVGFDATRGRYVCFIDDDVFVERPFWKEAIYLLEQYPDRKLIASPIYTASHQGRCCLRGNIDGHTLNTRSGSNCLLMKRETFLDIGRFLETPGRAKDGVEFCNRQIDKGYLVIQTMPGIARDVGLLRKKYRYD